MATELVSLLAGTVYEIGVCVCVYLRKLAQVSSVDDQGKDKDVSFAQRNEADEV